MRLRVRTHGQLCCLRAAICVLRPVAYFASGRSTGRSTQIAARRPHGIYVWVRAIAFMLIDTQHASEIAGNSVALLVDTQRECPAHLRCSARVPLAFSLRSARAPSTMNWPLVANMIYLKIINLNDALIYSYYNCMTIGNK